MAPDAAGALAEVHARRLRPRVPDARRSKDRPADRRLPDAGRPRGLRLAGRPTPFPATAATRRRARTNAKLEVRRVRDRARRRDGGDDVPLGERRDDVRLHRPSAQREATTSSPASISKPTSATRRRRRPTAATAFAPSCTSCRRACRSPPRRITPKSIVRGPQTAVVVGPAGDEIHTDKHGRVKVQFRWDRVGPKNERQLLLGPRRAAVGEQGLRDDRDCRASATRWWSASSKAIPTAR